MNLSNIPHEGDKPQLLAAIKKENNSILWAYDGEVLYESSYFKDGTEWYFIHRQGSTLVGSATDWFYAGGTYSVSVTGMEPDDFVRALDSCALTFYPRGEG